MMRQAFLRGVGASFASLLVIAGSAFMFGEKGFEAGMGVAGLAGGIVLLVSVIKKVDPKRALVAFLGFSAPYAVAGAVFVLLGLPTRVSTP